MVASNRWHEMQNIVAEIDKLETQIFDAKIHQAKNKYSSIATKLIELQSSLNAEVKKLDKHLTEWQESL